MRSTPDLTKVSISCSAIFFAIAVIGLGLILSNNRCLQGKVLI
ncbi:hypothetical protein BN890_8880 [Bacteroides xylanisolvens SD CC 1b]|uniref:Uncharacterized protein n=1 Tax=Bacteroides xylanisolvens SD CC 1b TaxID=702447 RepID=W6PH31_9BACE|nr:hypothetical protein BN890_8880 [Bacteroides xylanisolvens SD CC 1b]